MSMKTGKPNLLMVVPRVVSRAGDWYLPPLGLAYISAVLKLRYATFCLNLNDSDDRLETRLAEAIRAQDIDIVLTGGVTGQYLSIHDILAASKKLKPEITTIVGGGIITSQPIEAMEALEHADYGVIGEGEIIVGELIETLCHQGDITDVAGITYKSELSTLHMNPDGKVWRTLFKRSEKPIQEVDISHLPYPDYDGIGYAELIRSAPNILGMSETNTLPILTSRGCPFKCTFCFQPDGQDYRMRDLDDVFAEIDSLIDRYDIRYLIVFDELFGAKKGRVEEFCQRIKPYGIRWTATFRIPQLTREVVSLLKDSNFHTASLGIESMDDTVLTSMKKKIKRKQIEDGLALLHEAGIGIQGVLIFGDPVETVTTAKNTLDWWAKHIQYDLQLSAIITYPGTPVYDHAIAKGLIKDPIKYIQDGCPIVRLSDMSAEEYAWMFGQILSLPRESYSIPDNLTITRIDFRKANLSATGNCVNCHQPNNWRDIRAFMLESMTCVKCGRRHILPIPPEFIDRISSNLAKLRAQYEQCAFWGINSYFYAFVKAAYLSLGEFYLVDRGEARVGVRIGGIDKQIVVRDTRILDEQQIRCVIVSVPNYYSVIESSVLATHPSVERVLSITDLLYENLTADKGTQRSLAA